MEQIENQGEGQIATALTLSSGDQQFSGDQRSSDRAVVVRALTERLPLNELDLPEGIYRPDLLPSNANQLLPTASDDVDVDDADEYERQRKAHLAVAYIPLSYDEGFPTTPDGRPFWSRLEFEPLEAYEVFKDYLAQGLNGARQIFLLADADTTASARQFTTGKLQEFFNLYYWAFRARAYDLFRVAESRRSRFERALAVEDNQFLLSERLMGICGVYWEWLTNGDETVSAEDLIKSLKPKTIIELTKMATQLQRISSDLPAAGPSAQTNRGNLAGKAGGAPMSTKDTIRDLTKPEGESEDMTAEDVVRKILQLNQQFNITINADGNSNTGETPPTPDEPYSTPIKVIQDLAEG